MKAYPVIISNSHCNRNFREFLDSHKEIPSPGGCLSKPIDRTEFLSKVRELLS